VQCVFYLDSFLLTAAETLLEAAEHVAGGEQQQPAWGSTVLSHCTTARPNHIIPDLRIDSAPLFLRRQCDRALRPTLRRPTAEQALLQEHPCRETELTGLAQTLRLRL
jgi:hypothetical protein